MTKTLSVFILVASSAVARADLGDPRAISVSNDFEVGAFEFGTQGSISIAPAVDWFPVRGLSIGAELGGGLSWDGFDPDQLAWSVGARVGYAFRLPGRWTIWPRIGVQASGVSSPQISDHYVVADILFAKAIGDHVYLGLRAESTKTDWMNVPMYDVHAVIGATF